MLKKLKKVHLMGLISSGGVHSHYDHLYELINISEIYNSKVFIHGFTDGRMLTLNPQLMI